MIRRTFLLFAILILPNPLWAESPAYFDEIIFPLEARHNHASCVVVCPNGDLLVCWYRGSGERRADDVAVYGARKRSGDTGWSTPFVLADAPGFPDVNPAMIIDPRDRLWLFWGTVQANTWESVLMKYRISSDYTSMDGPPRWDESRVLHVKPGAEFEKSFKEKARAYEPWNTQRGRQKELVAKLSRDAGDKLTRRLGWFTRAHPVFLDSGRMLLGLYSDGFSFSLVGLTDDLGKSWRFSEPIVGAGCIQPTFAVGADGVITAYMRDAGPLPKSVHVSQSNDGGETWSGVQDHPNLKNPGAGLEVMTLNDGTWLCIYNDLSIGRHSLAVSLSEDDGATWPWTRHLELMAPGVGSFHYPSIVQDGNGTLHATYSYFLERPGPGRKRGKTIKYARFNTAWVKAGDREGP